MAHAHDHAHDHAPKDFGRAFAIGVSLNLGFVLIEAFYGYVADSLALIADAGHNLSDVFGLLLAWGAAWLSRRAPTPRRTYGYRRSSILAALANAVVLLIAVGGIMWEAIRRFGAPAPIDGGIVMWVAAVGIAVNAGTAMLFMSGRKDDLNIQGAFLHMAADAAVSLGVVIAAAVIMLTGWLWLDPVVSILIAIVITVGTWGLLRDSVNLAMDAVPDNIDPHAVEAYLAGQPDVQEVHDLHIWGMSTTETALTVHLVRPAEAMDDGLLARLRHDLHHQFGIAHTTIQVEICGSATPCPQAPAHVV
ncbi:MAG: cation diffusion facilitator family transporter [Geminicoccaceae bacterium]